MKQNLINAISQFEGGLGAVETAINALSGQYPDGSAASGTFNGLYNLLTQLQDSSGAFEQILNGLKEYANSLPDDSASSN